MHDMYPYVVLCITVHPPQVERVLLKQYHHSREYVTGTLCLTDRHLIFIEPTGAQESWVSDMWGGGGGGGGGGQEPWRGGEGH